MTKLNKYELVDLVMSQELCIRAGALAEILKARYCLHKPVDWPKVIDACIKKRLVLAFWLYMPGKGSVQMITLRYTTLVLP